MFTGVFCCAARQNCAQCRWPWEWPTRKDNVSFGWRRPGMTEYKVSSLWDLITPTLIMRYVFLGYSTPNVLVWWDLIQMFTFQTCVFQICRNGFPSNFWPFVDWSSTSRNLQTTSCNMRHRPAFNGEIAWPSGLGKHKFTTCTMWNAKAVTLCRC